MGGRRALAAVRRSVGVPLAALRRTASDPRLVRVQLAWAAVMVASWITTVSLSVVAFDEGGSAAVALAVLARTVPGVVIGPVAGALVDRFPRQLCLTVAAVLCALASAGAVFAAGSLVASIALVTVIALVTMLFRTAQSAIIPELVDDPVELTAANVLSSAVEAVGLFAGPALAAGLLLAQGPALAFGVAAALFVVAGLLGAPAGRPPGGGRGRGSGAPGPHPRPAPAPCGPAGARATAGADPAVRWPRRALPGAGRRVARPGGQRGRPADGGVRRGRRGRVPGPVRPGRVSPPGCADVGGPAAVVAAVAAAAARSGARRRPRTAGGRRAPATCCST